MLTLYQFSNSICTQKVLMTLEEKGLEYSSVEVNLFTGEQYKPGYLKINPKGVVPSLIHNGLAVIESTLICEYLEEVFPDDRLMPESAYHRTRVRLWSKLVDEQLFQATREITFSCHFRHRMRDMTEEEREKRYQNVADPERTARIRSTFELGVDSPYVYQAIGHWEKAFYRLESELANSGPWLVNEEFGLADINMIPLVWRLEFLDLLDLWLADRPAVQEWWSLAKTRPSAISAIPDRLTPQEIDNMQRLGSAIREDVDRRRQEYLTDYGIQ